MNKSLHWVIHEPPRGGDLKFYEDKNWISYDTDSKRHTRDDGSYYTISYNVGIGGRFGNTFLEILIGFIIPSFIIYRGWRVQNKSIILTKLAALEKELAEMKVG
ncbi:hypothetical protein [Rubritalea profundi]|nr:hypothetical protein [Rubritalea profundi]